MILLALAGCLPHGAVSRGAEVEAAVYELRMADSGPDAPAERLTRQFARSFPDGTAGWLVCLESAGHCAELRTFDTGEIVQVRGVGSWPVADRSRLAPVWPLLAPHVDSAADLLTGWPVGTVTHASVRIQARGGWRVEGAGWRWTPELVPQGLSAITGSGHLDATLHLRQHDVMDAAWVAELPWCLPDGTCVTWRSAGSLHRAGTSPHRPVHPCPQHGEDAGRAPLCGADELPVDDPVGGLELVSFLGAGLSGAKAATVHEEASP